MGIGSAEWMATLTWHALLQMGTVLRHQTPFSRCWLFTYLLDCMNSYLRSSPTLSLFFSAFIQQTQRMYVMSGSQMVSYGTSLTTHTLNYSDE